MAYICIFINSAVRKFNSCNWATTNWHLEILKWLLLEKQKCEGGIPPWDKQKCLKYASNSEHSDKVRGLDSRTR